MTAPGSPAPAASTAHSLPADLRGGNASLLDRIRPIWRISGQVELPPGHSPSGAIDQLEPLFDAVGTRYERSDEGLIFTKKDPAAQDKLAVFDAGILHIADDGSGRSLRYTLNSRIMLACFLAPLLFLGFAQVTLATGAWEKAAAEAEKKTKPDKKKKDGGKEFVLNPIDVALGAPAPRTKKEMAALKAEKEKEPPSATPAFVFAGMFAALYVIGRILEAQRVNALFRKALQSP